MPEPLLKNLLIFLLAVSVCCSEPITGPLITIDRPVDLTILSINNLVAEYSDIYDIRLEDPAPESDPPDISLVTSGRISSSFINELKDVEPVFHMSTLAYISDRDSRQSKLTCHSNYSLMLDDGGKSLISDRRVFNIPLQEAEPDNYRISAIGSYSFRENLINLTTEGTIVVVSSLDPEIATKIVYFGSYDPFQSNTNSSRNPDRLFGHITDDLDE